MKPLIDRILDLAVSIQQIPAPTFQEAERAGFVRACFAAEGLTQVTVDSVGNVLACLQPDCRPARAEFPPVIVSAHLDTVFPAGTDLGCKRGRNVITAPGIGDNSLGVAGLLGLVWALRERRIQLPGNLWLAANVCEEGLGNLRGMQAIIDRFGPQRKDPTAKTGALAYIIIEGMSLGQVYQRGLSVERFRLSVQTTGGHSWVNHGEPSAIHEIATIINRLTGLSLPAKPRTTLNVGTISGGSTVNSIASEATLDLDLRSEDGGTLQDLLKRVEQVASAARRAGVQVRMEAIGRRPGGELPAGHWLVRLAQDSLRQVGMEPRLNTGSTDANLPLSLGYPALTIGLTTGGKGHTLDEFMNIAPLEKGVEQLVALVSRAWSFR